MKKFRVYKSYKITYVAEVTGKNEDDALNRVIDYRDNKWEEHDCEPIDVTVEEVSSDGRTITKRH